MMINMFSNWQIPNSRIPNSLEKVYSKHIIGKGELKSKIGRIHIGGNTKETFMLNTLVLDLFGVAKLGENGGGQPEEEVQVVVSHVYEIPSDNDIFVSDLFNFSLTHNIVEVNPNNARIYLARSKNGKTNITKDIVEILMGILSPFGKSKDIDNTPSDMI